MSEAYPWVKPPWPKKALPREQLEDRVQQLLGSTNMCVVATNHANGQPIASPIEYWADGLDVYILPDPGTPKLKSMQRDPRVCVAVHGAYHGWHSARGVQLFGAGRDHRAACAGLGPRHEDLPLARVDD